ncbi:hypothetical protein GCM10018965_000580 [Nonomuraea roseola]
MGELVISENISLDGVIQDPTGEEGFSFGGWFGRMGDKDREAWARVEFEEALGTEALLLGGRSYEWFASRWSSRSGLPHLPARPRRLATAASTSAGSPPPRAPHRQGHRRGHVSGDALATRPSDPRPSKHAVRSMRADGLGPPLRSRIDRR